MLEDSKGYRHILKLIISLNTRKSHPSEIYIQNKQKEKHVATCIEFRNVYISLAKLMASVSSFLVMEG